MKNDAGSSSPVVTGKPSIAWWAPVFFGLLLIIHVFLATRNLSAGALRGHEFRQTQTAISAQYIQAERNFSLSYPTPVLGKPWSVPMEFPLYQWCVVQVSDRFDLSLVMAGRIVSLSCFYLMLPALYVLLAGLGVSPLARWSSLCLVVSCPVYIFYTRAFMIEAMALMLSSWYLTAFVLAMRSGRSGWLVLGVVSGIGAALVKVTTLMIWMAPAAGYGFFLLARSFGQGWTEARRTLARGLLLAAGPGLAAIWWVRASDAIKALNPSGRFLMSAPMQAINFSTWTERFQWDLWSGILHNWSVALMPLGLMLGVGMLILAESSPWRRPATWAVVVFLGAQCTFPRLFSWHDYYFYAIGVFWLGATGIAISALTETRLKRGLAAGLLLSVLAAQYYTYGTSYFRLQTTPGNGGTGLTDALRALTSRQGVLIVCGYDWSAELPYYAQRRALMIRASTEHDHAYIKQAFAGLVGEEISALVLSGGQRNNRELIAEAVATFDLSPTIAFSHQETDVYLPKSRRDWVVARLRDAPVFEGVLPQGGAPAAAAIPAMDRTVHGVNPHTDRALFGRMSPWPVRYRFAYDANAGVIDGESIVTAHPDSDLWFVAPSEMKEIACVFGILPGAYEREGASTDGVEFLISEKRPDGTAAVIFHRFLQPVTNPGDRGLQRIRLPCRATPGSELVFSTRPGGNYAFDWAYWGPISLH